MYIFEIIYDYLINHPTTFAIAAILMLVIPVKNILIPHMYGKVIDAIGSSGSSTTLLHTFILLISIMVITHILMFIGNIHDAHIIPSLKSHVRRKMVSSMLDKHETEHKEVESGIVMSKLMKMTYIGSDWFMKVKNYLLPNLLVMLFGVIYFSWKDYVIGGGLCLLLVLTVYLIYRSTQVCRKVSTTLDKKFNQVNEHIEDTLRNLFSVYGSNNKERELENVATLSKQHEKFYAKTMICGVRAEAFIITLMISYIVFFVWRCYTQVRGHRMDKQSFIAMFIILLYIMNGITRLVDQVQDVVIDSGSMEVSRSIFKEDNAGKTSTHPFAKMFVSNTQTLPSTGIGLKNVTFAYNNQHTSKPVLSNKTVHFPSGEKTIMVGDIGAGKSTIMKLMMKYYIPEAGNGIVYMNGTDINEIPTDVLRKRIGYVPQQPVLFDRTLLENILYGNETRTRQDVEALMKRYDVYKDLGPMMDKRIGKNGSAISGGQRQVTWCLRILLSNPEVIMLDEPTASVNEKTKKIIHRMFIDDIDEDKTVIMITHDPYMIENATNIIRV